MFIQLSACAVELSKKGVERFKTSARYVFISHKQTHMWPPWEQLGVNEGNEIQQLLIIGSV